MPEIRIRQAEGCDGDPYLAWDTVWTADRLALENGADWVLAGADEPDNRGGLRAKAGLATAIILCLFTDKRCPPDHPLAYLADGEALGWWGDAVDVNPAAGEVELGSLFRLLKRAPLTGPKGEEMRRWAEVFAADALQPIRAQGVVARFDCIATVDEAREQIGLQVSAYASDGTILYDRRFDQIWEQTR